MNSSEIRSLMLQKTDAKYKNFASSLIPGIKKEKFLGVRIPDIRKIAEKVNKEDVLKIINSFPEDYFEDIMLKGFLISLGDLSFEERCCLIKGHLKKTDNWSLCDSFVSSLKFIKNDRDRFLEFIMPFFKSENEYEARFAVVVLINYYNSSDRVLKNLELISQVKEGGFYADMSLAWAISQFFAEDSTVTFEFLKNDRLSDFVHNKAIEKIRESYKISKEDKEKVKHLKR